MKKWLILVYVAIFCVFFLFFLRLISEKQLDDVSPGILCQEDILTKSDVLFIVPKYENHSISDDKGWCNKIKNLNKTLALHGVYHNYKEFSEDREEEYLAEGIKIFQDCFNQSPAGFKPPQLAISENNKKLISSKMKRYNYFDQITYRVYHCNDTGMFPNWVIDWI